MRSLLGPREADNFNQMKTITVYDIWLHYATDSINHDQIKQLQLYKLICISCNPIFL